jgi:hypothetical protein
MNYTSCFLWYIHNTRKIVIRAISFRITSVSYKIESGTSLPNIKLLEQPVGNHKLYYEIKVKKQWWVGCIVSTFSSSYG